MRGKEEQGNKRKKKKQVTGKQLFVNLLDAAKSSAPFDKKSISLKASEQGCKQQSNSWVVVLAQLGERSTLTPKLRSLNPTIKNGLSTICINIVME